MNYRYGASFGPVAGFNWPRPTAARPLQRWVSCGVARRGAAGTKVGQLWPPRTKFNGKALSSHPATCSSTMAGFDDALMETAQKFVKNRADLYGMCCGVAFEFEDAATIPGCGRCFDHALLSGLAREHAELWPDALCRLLSAYGYDELVERLGEAECLSHDALRTCSKLVHELILAVREICVHVTGAVPEIRERVTGIYQAYVSDSSNGAYEQFTTTYAVPAVASLDSLSSDSWSDPQVLVDCIATAFARAGIASLKVWVAQPVRECSHPDLVSVYPANGWFAKPDFVYGSGDPVVADVDDAQLPQLRALVLFKGGNHYELVRSGMRALQLPSWADVHAGLRERGKAHLLQQSNATEAAVARVMQEWDGALLQVGEVACVESRAAAMAMFPPMPVAAPAAPAAAAASTPVAPALVRRAPVQRAPVRQAEESPATVERSGNDVVHATNDADSVESSASSASVQSNEDGEESKDAAEEKRIWRLCRSKNALQESLVSEMARATFGRKVFSLMPLVKDGSRPARTRAAQARRARRTVAQRRGFARVGAHNVVGGDLPSITSNIEKQQSAWRFISRASPYLRQMQKAAQQIASARRAQMRNDSLLLLRFRSWRPDEISNGRKSGVAIEAAVATLSDRDNFVEGFGARDLAVRLQSNFSFAQGALLFLADSDLEVALELSRRGCFMYDAASRQLAASRWPHGSANVVAGAQCHFVTHHFATTGTALRAVAIDLLSDQERCRGPWLAGLIERGKRVANHTLVRFANTRLHPARDLDFICPRTELAKAWLPAASVARVLKDHGVHSTFTTGNLRVGEICSVETRKSRSGRDHHFVWLSPRFASLSILETGTVQATLVPHRTALTAREIDNLRERDVLLFDSESARAEEEMALKQVNLEQRVAQQARAGAARLGGRHLPLVKGSGNRFAPLADDDDDDDDDENDENEDDDNTVGSSDGSSDDNSSESNDSSDDSSGSSAATRPAKRLKDSTPRPSNPAALTRSAARVQLPTRADQIAAKRAARKKTQTTHFTIRGRPAARHNHPHLDARALLRAGGLTLPDDADAMEALKRHSAETERIITATAQTTRRWLQVRLLEFELDMSIGRR